MQNVYMGMDVEDFIFGEGTTYEDNFDNVTDEEMNRFGVIECVDDPDVACYRIALENEQNHSAIMMAMMNKEYEVLESTGAEMVYEAGTISNFLDMVKTQVQKFWAKVKGVFKKVMDKINSIVLSNKAFVKKYRAVAGELKMPKAKEFTGYDRSKANLVIQYSDVVNAIRGVKDFESKRFDDEMKKAKESNMEYVQTSLESIRGILCGSSTVIVTAEEFNTKLKEHIYGAKNTSNIPVDPSFTKLLDRLETADIEKKAAKDSHKEAEKTVKGMLSEINKEKSNAKNDAAIKRAKVKGEIISKSLNVMSAALSVQTKAIITFAIQDRKMANYWVNANNVKGGTTSGKDAGRDSANESFSFGDIDVTLV